jgi:hypothetical protein
MSRANSVWVAPSATSYSCLCETCLELARNRSLSFLEAVRGASVRGHLPADTDVGFVRCAAGHELVVRRIDTPPTLGRRDARQLQIV